MCLQISQGMEYLTSQSIIHRDLAARNCMWDRVEYTNINIVVNFFACRIDSDGVIKVADFGLSKSAYEKLYFRENKSENVKLPIKWLAIECMEDGVFSEKSDVVSTTLIYTLWLLLAFSKFYAIFYSGHLEWHVGRYSVVVRYHMEDCHHWVYQGCWKVVREWKHQTMQLAHRKCIL